MTSMSSHRVIISDIRPPRLRWSRHEKFFVPFVFPSWLEMALGSHRCQASILVRRAQPRKSQQGQGIIPFSLK